MENRDHDSGRRPRAVMIGAGNIGRGFIGETFSRSGYDVVFVDVDEALVAALNREGRYPVRVVSDEGDTETLVGPVRAVSGRDPEAVARELAEADLAATAVGAGILPRIAPVLAKGLLLRWSRGNGRPLDLLICENLMDADRILRDLVASHLPPGDRERLDRSVGFVEASIGRMVPVMTPEQKAENPLLVCVEAFRTLPVDRDAFRGPIPALADLEPFSPFGYHLRRKLYIHNMGHALVAYLGALSGHERIRDAVEDPEIRSLAEAAMHESADALSAEYGVDRAILRDHVADLLHRFGNRKLGDTIDRVGRDPMRKLAADDRLAGAARYCLDRGVFPRAIAVGLAAALLARQEDDPGSAELAARLSQEGPEGFLRSHCGLDDPGLLRHILALGTALAGLRQVRSAPPPMVAGHLCLDISPAFRDTGARALSDLLVPGKLVDVGQAVLSTGGAVSNTGLSIRLMGLPVRLSGKVGPDLFGEGVGRTLDRYGGREGLIVDPEARTSYSIVIAPPAVDRIFLHDPAANDTFGADDPDEAMLREAPLFHFGYPPLMRRMYRDDGDELVRLLARVRSAGAAVSLDMALPDPASEAGRADWAAILARALPLTDLFLPSLEELLFMLDRPAFQRLREAGGDPGGRFGPEDLSALGDRLVRMGVAMAAIKLGTRGYYLRTAGPDRLRHMGRLSMTDPVAAARWADRELHHECFVAEPVVSASGAGDASIAGFLSGLLTGLGPEDCLALANAAGSLNVLVRESVGGVKPLVATLVRIPGWETIPAWRESSFFVPTGAGACRRGPRDRA